MPQITPQQARAIDLLTAGMSVRDVAAELRVNTKTVYRWLARADVLEELHRKRSALREAVHTRLHAEADAAASVILELMTDKSVAAAVRHKAALAVLERLDRTELDEIAARLVAVEALAVGAPDEPETAQDGE